jgi:hypothetical protein
LHTRAYTRDPSRRLGRFRFVAPSNAREPRVALALHNKQHQ